MTLRRPSMRRTTAACSQISHILATHLVALCPSLLRPDTEPAGLLPPALTVSGSDTVVCSAPVAAGALAAPTPSQVTLMGAWFLENFFP